MLGLIGVLLLLWLVVVLIGVLVKGLFWLVVVGAVLFFATGALGLRNGRSHR